MLTIKRGFQTSVRSLNTTQVSTPQVSFLNSILSKVSAAKENGKQKSQNFKNHNKFRKYDNGSKNKITRKFASGNSNNDNNNSNGGKSNYKKVMTDKYNPTQRKKFVPTQKDRGAKFGKDSNIEGIMDSTGNKSSSFKSKFNNRRSNNNNNKSNRKNKNNRPSYARRFEDKDSVKVALQPTEYHPSNLTIQSLLPYSQFVPASKTLRLLEVSHGGAVRIDSEQFQQIVKGNYKVVGTNQEPVMGMVRNLVNSNSSLQSNDRARIYDVCVGTTSVKEFVNGAN